jgi:hypothetical protein
MDCFVTIKWRAFLESSFWSHTIFARITWHRAEKQMGFWAKTALVGGRGPPYLGS